MNLYFRNCFALAIASCCCLTGCSGGIHTVPVYGVVKFAGRDSPKVCRLFFRPIQTTEVAGAAARPSAAEADEYGAYQVRAFKDSDGLLPGTYSILIMYFDLKPGRNPEDEASWIQRNYDAGQVVVAPDADEVEHNIDVPARS